MHILLPAFVVMASLVATLGSWSRFHGIKGKQPGLEKIVGQFRSYRRGISFAVSVFCRCGTGGSTGVRRNESIIVVQKPGFKKLLILADGLKNLGQ